MMRRENDSSHAPPPWPKEKMTAGGPGKLSLCGGSRSDVMKWLRSDDPDSRQEM